MGWKLKDKHGKYRSRRAYKQDARQKSTEPWEIRQDRADNRFYGQSNRWQKVEHNRSMSGHELKAKGNLGFKKMFAKEGSVQDSVNKRGSFYKWKF